MPSKNLLLAVGFTLIVLGIVTRGLARTQRRRLALRRQHELDVRKRGEPLPPLSHLERHLGNYANGVAAAGVVAVLAAMLR